MPQIYLIHCFYLILIPTKLSISHSGKFLQSSSRLEPVQLTGMCASM